MPSPASYLGEELPGLRCKSTAFFLKMQEKRKNIWSCEEFFVILQPILRL